MKIVIIGVYFGILPEYFPLWAKSCEMNPEIDFYVFTDSVVNTKVKNLFIHNMNLCEFKELVKQKLNMDICLDTPYKCCDYKPAYGVIFEDYIKKYDYWGHCDFDMIFGDLMYFFKKYKLDHYDKFLPLGHLSLYKNNKEVNSRYMMPGSYVDYKTVFSSNESMAFDEVDGMCSIYKKNGFPFFDSKIFADIDQQHKRFRLSTYYSDKESCKNYVKQIFYWENGKVFRTFYDGKEEKQDEFIYIHFQKRKSMSMSLVDNIDSLNAFYVSNVGFVPKHEDSMSNIIEMYNKK